MRPFQCGLEVVSSLCYRPSIVFCSSCLATNSRRAYSSLNCSLPAPWEQRSLSSLHGCSCYHTIPLFLRVPFSKLTHANADYTSLLKGAFMIVHRIVTLANRILHSPGNHTISAVCIKVRQGTPEPISTLNLSSPAHQTIAKPVSFLFWDMVKYCPSLGIYIYSLFPIEFIILQS